MSEAVAADEETAAYVEELESRAEEIEEELPSGETLAAELTRFLREREQGDGDGTPPADRAVAAYPKVNAYACTPGVNVRSRRPRPARASCAACRACTRRRRTVRWASPPTDTSTCRARRGRGRRSSPGSGARARRCGRRRSAAPRPAMSPSTRSGRRQRHAPAVRLVAVARRSACRRSATGRAARSRGTTPGVVGSVGSCPATAAASVADAEQRPDRLLRLRVAALAEVVVADPALPVDQVLGRPVLVRVVRPGGVLVVLDDRVGDPEPLDRGGDVRGDVLESELGRVDADDHEPVAVVGPVPRLEVRQRAQAVDARVRPEVDQHDLAAQARRA